MGNKEEVTLRVEGFLQSQRKAQEKKEATEYDVRISRDRAVFLRNALEQKRVNAMIVVTGTTFDSGMLQDPSVVEQKLGLAIAVQELDTSDVDEVLLHLQASDIDSLNTTLFPTVNRFDESSLVVVDHIAAVNNRYRTASGIERPSFVEGMKPYQI